RRIIGTVDDRAVPAFLGDQSGAAELGQMEGKRRVGDTKRLGDCTRSHALLAGLHQQPEQAQAMLLGKGAKRIDRCSSFHTRTFISTQIEMIRRFKDVNSKNIEMTETVVANLFPGFAQSVAATAR